MINRFNNAKCPAHLRINGAVEQSQARSHYSRRKSLFNFKAYRHKNVKKSLNEIFHGKCAYCERRHKGNYFFPIDHYRPKGDYVDSSGATYSPAYWWLASSWKNLLPSCGICNGQGAKGNYFPIANKTHRVKRGCEYREKPFLINPRFEKPQDYINFSYTRDSEGRIRKSIVIHKPKSLRGELTIYILKLNRPDLVRTRTEKMKTLEISLNLFSTQMKRLPRLKKGISLKRDLLINLKQIENYFLSKTCEFSAAANALFREWLKDHKIKSKNELKKLLR